MASPPTASARNFHEAALGHRVESAPLLCPDRCLYEASIRLDMVSAAAGRLDLHSPARGPRAHSSDDLFGPHRAPVEHAIEPAVDGLLEARPPLTSAFRDNHAAWLVAGGRGTGCSRLRPFGCPRAVHDLAAVWSLRLSARSVTMRW